MIYDNNIPHSKFEYQSEIEELKQRISQGEVEVRLLRMKGNNQLTDIG